jgi:hypothetical protein
MSPFKEEIIFDSFYKAHCILRECLYLCMGSCLRRKVTSILSWIGQKKRGLRNRWSSTSVHFWTTHTNVHIGCKVSKAIPVTDHRRPIGLREVKAPTLLRQTDNRWQ